MDDGRAADTRRREPGSGPACAGAPGQGAPAGADPVALVFDGPEVGLAEMLDARENRARIQRDLLAEALAGESLFSATLSIPGPHKTSDALERVFAELVEAVTSRLGGARVRARTRLSGAPGPELLMLVKMPALELKGIAVDVEESHPLGRLADFDVVELTDGMPRPVSRTELGFPPRTCLICGGEAKACARSRAHTVREMQETIAEIIRQGGCCTNG